MNFLYLIMLNNLLVNSYSFQFHDFKKCHKKIKVKYRFFKLKVVPQLAEETRNQIESFKEVDTRKSIIQSSVDESTDDLSSEIFELFSLATNTNKEFLFLFQQILNQYFKVIIENNLSKKYNFEFDTKDIIKLIIRNIIIPTIIHDIFQYTIYVLHIKN